jgi:K+-sensing histidine kinase KdpD
LSEIENAKSEILFAVSSTCYLRHFASLGIIDYFEKAQNKGAKVLILCPNQPQSDDSSSNDREEWDKLFLAIKRYAQISRIDSGIKGTVLVIDNKAVLTISEESIDAIAVHSNNKSLVNNFASLFSSLWDQETILHSLAEANAKMAMHSKMQKEFINIAAHELRTPITPILVALHLAQKVKTADGTSQTLLAEEQAEMIERNAKRLEKLAADILTVTRIEGKRTCASKREGRPKPMDCGRDIEL